MEAFRGFEGKFQCQISGHSGDAHYIPFVVEKLPVAMKETYAVIEKMHAHASVP
jgi:hypothetical protein